MSVDLHAAQIQGFFDGPLDHLFAKPVLLEYFQRTVDDRAKLTVVSPDMGRVRVADIWSDSLDAPLAIIHKRRDPNVPNQVTVHEIVGEVAGQDVPARRRHDRHRRHDRQGRRGAEGRRRRAASSSPRRTRSSATRPSSACSRAAIDEVVVTDTLPLPPEKRFPKLEILPIAPLLARAIHEVFEDGSVTRMFDGAA